MNTLETDYVTIKGRDYLIPVAVRSYIIKLQKRIKALEEGVEAAEFWIGRNGETQLILDGLRVLLRRATTEPDSTATPKEERTACDVCGVLYLESHRCLADPLYD